MKRADNKGFTLIELIVVVAVLAIIATIAIGKYDDIQKDAARKANRSNINNITSTINTYLVSETNHEGLFDYVESLIDLGADGKSWTGSAGEYDWTKNTDTDYPGVYAGIKYVPSTVSNAGGVTSSTSGDVLEARKKNSGIPSSFRSSLGIHYLTQKEVDALYEAGVSTVLMHNYTSGQAKGPASRYPLVTDTDDFCDENGLTYRNGGPGHRADMSAFYPVVLTNGSPVVVINPNQADIYRALGVDYDITEDFAASSPEDYYSDGICPRLIVFGLGRSSDITSKLFQSPPKMKTLDNTHYNNYLLVFAMKNGTGNTGYTTEFVGVIDSEGNTAKAAQYDLDWAN